MEIEVIKKTQTEVILKIKSTEKRKGTTDTSITNRRQEMKERNLGEDKIEEIDTSVKENVKSKKFQSQSIQEICHTMKMLNLRIIGIKKAKSASSKE